MVKNKRYKLNFTLADGSTKSVECDIPVSEGVSSLILDGNKTLSGNIELSDHFATDYSNKSINADNKIKLNPIPADYINCTGWRRNSTQEYISVDISHGSNESVVYVTLPNLYAKLDAIELKVTNYITPVPFTPTKIENLGNNKYKLTFEFIGWAYKTGVLQYYIGCTQTDNALEFLYRNGVYKHFISLTSPDESKTCYFTVYAEDSKAYTTLSKLFYAISYVPGVMYIKTNGSLNRAECVSAYEITTYSTSGSTITRYIRSGNDSTIVTDNWTYKDIVSLLHCSETDLLPN